MSKTPGATTIQNLLANKQYPQALVAVQQLLTVNQDDPQNNYLAAVCARYCRQFELAQQYLDQLPGRFVDQARLLQEQGHLYRDSGQGQQALACYRAACLANPALVSAWQAQLQLAEQMGQPAQLPFIQAQLQRLAKLPKALIAVSDLISQGKLLKAETLCRKFMQANPTHPEGMGLLADLASKFGAYNEAELLLQSALELAPTNTQLRSEYIGVLRRRQKFAEAYKEAEALHKQQPDNPQFQSLLAIEKMQLSDYEGAVALFKRVLARLPQDPITLTSQGHALKTWGKQAEAIKSYQQAAEQGHGEAFYALANLKTYSFSERQIAQLQQLLQQKHLSDNNRVHIEFALGKAFE
ncbi:MAG: tetratricopeptide repeat protein, partial [Cellvibrionaceae bacterium]|nr:tetratricopeptide repeat protein [Cellvibrionaceae bacterium]